MAIVGLGLDLAQISRFEAAYARRGERMLERLFTPGERAYCERKKERISSYCGRFAVKEAVMKVLGTGWTRGVRWIDIEVVRAPGSAPQCVLHGASAAIAQKKGIRVIHITITHDAGIAAAVAVAES
ncbi:MAG: holo-ACP synthase [Planctomycetes bacterium]|nr:holo-ACP synthase [Planctomycetota bacterium]